jgi:hypothetical protein
LYPKPLIPVAVKKPRKPQTISSDAKFERPETGRLPEVVSQG